MIKEYRSPGTSAAACFAGMSAMPATYMNDLIPDAPPNSF